ncbi:hypothetical protein EUX98_g3518 [Antrodiella citrinella]|uniref:DASH complex subunit DAM1 n=1 Tax=Antrodiella citrinella TaxID=2447956 RepID=A0A4S4MYS0_9APHY|nr:hypothetical protein EUX98_g3518 [Antrodiella citrinella]
MEPALGELVDEAEALQVNVEGLKTLSNALSTFNESFASWLYVMNMNALTTDWPQAPTDASFLLAKRRAEADAIAALEALQAAQKSPTPEPIPDHTAASDIEQDTTFAANTTATTTASSNPAPTKGILKKKTTGKPPKLTAKEKRERGLAIDKIVSALPLEFRGNDPNLRRNIEQIIETFMDKPGKGIGILELVKPPDLNQARVNKCLIALVNRKVVRKENSTGSVLYHWQGLPE